MSPLQHALQMFLVWCQTLVGGSVSRHNAALMVGNIRRMLVGTPILTVRVLLADRGETIVAWANRQFTEANITPKTIKNYLSAFTTFLTYVQILGYTDTEIVKAIVSRCRRGLRTHVKAQEATTAMANAGRCSSNNDIPLQVCP